MAQQKTTENSNDKTVFAVFGISDFANAEQIGEIVIAGDGAITLNAGVADTLSCRYGLRCVVQRDIAPNT